MTRQESGEAAIQDSLGHSPRNGNKTGELALKARENNRCLLGVRRGHIPGQTFFIYLIFSAACMPSFREASHKRISIVLRRYGETLDGRYILD